MNNANALSVATTQHTEREPRWERARDFVIPDTIEGCEAAQRRLAGILDEISDRLTLLRLDGVSEDDPRRARARDAATHRLRQLRRVTDMLAMLRAAESQGGAT